MGSEHLLSQEAQDLDKGYHFRLRVDACLIEKRYMKIFYNAHNDLRRTIRC